MKTLLSALPLSLLLAACQSGAPAQTPAEPTPHPALSRCGQRICTMQYEPVCATIVENGRSREQTFGNSCMVCSDSGKITATRKGACEAPEVR
ncbi:MAG: hypothetical protein Q4G28_03475 [Neisseria sp.]|nr:hypothetical protein [Neisseria sp.]